MPELNVETARSRQKRGPRQGRSVRKQQNESSLELTPFAARCLNALALLIFAAAIGFVLTSNIFAVERVTVVGARRVSADSVVSAAGLQGRSVFAVNTAETRARISASSPLIKDAFVEFRLPDEIVIRVDERVGFVAWRAGEATLDVSADGVVLGASDSAEAQVVVVDGDQRSLSVGDRIDPATLEGVYRLREAVPKALKIEIKEFTFSRAEGIGLVTPDGLKVLFGSADDLDRKLATLQSILEESKSSSRQLQLVDVRFQSRPYFR